MSRLSKLTIGLLVLGLAGSIAGAADDLKEYYEQQKAAIASSFRAPALGSEVKIKLGGGQVRTGILMKLSADSIALITDKGMVSYKRMALHKSSCAHFFAEDYAHLKALKKTKEYKQQLHLGSMADQVANIHKGRISVSSKTDKDSEKDVEEDEQENNAGDTVTTTTTTRTQTAIQNLKVMIFNNTTHPDTYSLEWYFLGTKLDTDSVSVHDSGSKKITVDARKRMQYDVSSEPFIVEKVAVNRSSSNSELIFDPRIKESGSEITGYVVLLKYQNEILDKKASASVYLSKAWLRRLRP